MRRKNIKICSLKCHILAFGPVSELMLCIPLNIYIKSLAPNASVLYSRLSITKLVPKEWTTSILVSQSHSSLFSMKQRIQNSSLDLIITIAPDCVWSMTIGTTQFCIDQCQLLNVFSSMLDSIDTVVKLLSCIDKSKVCKGNSDVKFDRYFTAGKFLLSKKACYFVFRKQYYDKRNLPTPTIRHKKCEIFISAGSTERCKSCDDYRFGKSFYSPVIFLLGLHYIH